ncbi:MAG: hypothetical protein WCO28_10640 [Bacteroidota bacterium]
MEELRLKITNIKIKSPDEIEISINVWDENDVTTILENLTDEIETPQKFLRSNNYSFLISPLSYALEPLNELEECLDIYHENESFENLNPKLRRQWKTANLVDSLTHKLFKEAYFKNEIYGNLKIEDFDKD